MTAAGFGTTSQARQNSTQTEYAFEVSDGCVASMLICLDDLKIMSVIKLRHRGEEMGELQTE